MRRGKKNTEGKGMGRLTEPSQEENVTNGVKNRALKVPACFWQASVTYAVRSSVSVCHVPSDNK